MNNLTRILLIVLRLSIGWFFVAEGLEKVHPHPTANLKEWSSAGYLRQSSGPLSPFFRWQAGGDADEVALGRLLVINNGQQVTPALRSDWEDYLARFTDHYHLTDAQKAEAKKKLDESLDNAAKWLADTTTRKELDKNTDFPTAAFAPRKSPAERVADYRAKVEEYRQAESVANPAFGEDVFKAKLRTMKADAAKTRAGLLADLEAPMHKALESVLNDDQKKLSAVPPPPPPPVLTWTDRLVSYGLVVVGAGLMLGVFTRLSCVVGALFLIALYLTLPPLPWSPEHLRAEGPSVFINKNLIMAVALLALATTRSGLWFGLDGLLHFLNPWSNRAERRARAENAAV
jgi:uncharacterized membrane protein YphA (DoxX/SURF4 family)